MITCGIRIDATVSCWGNASTGGIGDGTTTSARYPNRTVVASRAS